MMMKQLFRHTSTLLRTALLLGAMILVNTQTQAQNEEQLAKMPSAFETIEDVTSIIGDGHFYYIQFYDGSDISYLVEHGDGNNLRTKDYIPFATNRQWTLESAGGSSFYLKSARGIYARLDGTNYKGTNSQANATALTYLKRTNSQAGGGYEILVSGSNKSMERKDRAVWADVIDYDNNSNRYPGCRLRIAKLKDNIAHIIYWQEPIYRNGDTSQPVDPNTDSRANADGFTTHHYLTYSGTGDVISDAVSSRKSVVWYYDAWNTLPTLAAYHQDGLWTLEPAGDNGEFFIKKYGTEEYLNYQNLISELGAKNADFGKYALENPNANRYTRIKNANRFALNDLTAAMFFKWDGYGADPSSTSNASSIAFNVGNSVTLNSGNVVAGSSDGNVPCLVYANLTGSKKMLIEGTPGVQLRVMLNRQDSDSGPWTEKTVTLNSSGKGEVDLSDLPYAHLNSIKMGWSSPSGTISSIKLQSLSSSGSDLYLSCNKTDGIEVSQVSGGNASYLYTTDWVAGFMPVEVPVPNKDEFYQVQVRLFSASGDLLNYTGNAEAYTVAKEKSYLWQLEQVDDYKHFRLKRKSTGEYLAGQNSMTQPNDPDGALPTVLPNGNVEFRKAEVKTIDKYFGDFSVKWFYVNPAQKEFPVNYMVTHRESYLKQYAEQYADMELDKQGLATGAQSDWWNYEKQIQKTNHFEITHYVKQGNTMVVEFPTVLNSNNDHIYFQRFYNYDEADTDMDLDNLKAHVSLDTRDDGNVQYFLYKNGMVTGQKLDWTGIDNGGMARNALRRFNFTNSDGKRFTVAVDVSRYSDFEYKNKTTHLAGDLVEPSLTMRYIYYMRDAKEMAANLTACTSTTGKWLETKDFHFPSKQIAYESIKKAGYRGEFIGIRHIFSDYWTYDDPNFIKKDGSGKVVIDEKGNVIIDKKYINDTYHLKDSENNITEEELNDFLENHLVSAVKNVNEGRIVVRVDDTENSVGIRLGGYNPNIDLFGTTDGNDSDYKGYYHYDKMGGKNSYGDSRFVVFRYPSSGEIAANKIGKKTYLNVYFVGDDNTEYQLARYTIIFDENSETKPWKSVTLPVATTGVQGTDRDPNRLREKAGKPIAKITFDYPNGETYHFPASDASGPGTRHDGGDDRYGIIEKSSPIPLTFDNTNYAFDGDGANWGSYAMVDYKSTIYGNFQKCNPCNAEGTGYNMAPDAGMQNGFLYIDASEQPGDICSAPFVGDFCTGDKLRFSGWISGSNQAGGADNRCPGGVTLTIKGEHNLHDSEGRIIYDDNGNPKKEIVTLYRFCPGQCYELNDNTTAIEGVSWGVPDAQKNQYNVVWQQFYFEFVVGDKYDRHWIEVNNNCVSSNGGDFMLDNIEVYAEVPEVVPSINTPLCVKKDGTTEMRLLKLSINYNKLKSSRNVNDDYAYEGFVFLDKYKFLDTFRTELKKLSNEQKAALHLSAFDFTTITLDELADAIEDGEFSAITGNNEAYQKAFDAAILGNKTTWYSHSTDPDKTKMNSSIMYFRWSTTFEDDENMPLYSFADAVNKKHAVYREVDQDGVKWVVMNGNFPELQWRTNTDYYVINTNDPITEHNTGQQYSIFNLCSECTKASVFQIEPPYQLLSMESSEATEDLVVCEGKIPTVLTNLKGYDVNGKLIPMTGLNFDWWLGDPTRVKPDNPNVVVTDPTAPSVPRVKATIDNYHNQTNTDGTVKLDEALSALRAYYPDITSLGGVFRNLSKTPKLTVEMVRYLEELVEKGQLVLHQSTISIPAEKASGDDPYFYFVACPIHDAAFSQALNPQGNQYVSHYCDEPQGVRMKIGEKAPRLKCGFVPGENGFSKYDYTTVNDAVLSIRLAKKAQFEEVRHGTTADVAVSDPATATEGLHFLWLPIRDAEVQSTGSTGVIQKSDDYNIYLASTDDPVWDKEISRKMRQDKELPIFGKIVKLEAVNKSSETTDQTSNRLCIYFIKYGDTDADKEKFDVREGYSYTLSLPFKETPGENSCDGSILINVKIVPDYEVWTGAAGNTDWNNDQNWRRADGNTAVPSVEPTDESKLNNNELYVSNTLTEESGLYQYTTNYANYRKPLDRILRKGFAPLYCTHVLVKSNEWGDAPELYDALDAVNNIKLTASPFPNLRDKDGWDGSVTDETEGTTATKATATSILRFDMQARRYDIWSDTYGSDPNKGREGDLIAEMYQINSCDEIAFQPGAELRNAHLLNYNNAWVEYKLDMKRWYLLGSPLQGTISGEWYAPTGTAQQKTTYYENVTFGEGYDRYSPAIYQRSWDKAKAVLYEVGANYSTADNPNDLVDGGSASQGAWNGTAWNATGADDYLDRLGYKPMDGKKANVAIKGVWSNTYNDATVDYAKGGFSVMVMNHLKGSDGSDGTSIIRLPKEDTMYDYYKFEETGAANGGTDTYLSDTQENNYDDVQTELGRALNRGRLKTDLLLPTNTQKTETAASKYGDARTYTRVPTVTTNEINNESVATLPMSLRPMSETVSAGISNLGYYLVENPFPCGLDMGKFFTGNTQLLRKYWILTPTGQQLVQQVPDGTWIPSNGASFTVNEAKVAPGQGFFVQLDPASTAETPNVIKFTTDMQAQTRYGEADDGTPYTIVVGTRQKMKTIPVTYDHDDDPETAEVPLMIDDDDDPSTPEVQATMEVPEVDEYDNYVVEDITETVTIYNYKQASGDGKRFPLKTRGEGAEAILPGLVITAERDNSQSSALVMQRGGASNDFLPEEDTEVFINSDLVNAPTVYTLCGRLATTINTVRDFRSLPLGVESTSDAPCTLTFRGVEMLGDSISFYDAVEQKLTPLESGMTFKVSGQTQNRYYLVRSLNLKEAAEETHLQIFTEGLTARVIASTAEPITVVRCFDTAGRLIYSAEPQTSEHSFTLLRAGVYIIEAETEHDRKTRKVIVKL